MGAILFSRRGAMLTAAGSFLLLGAVVEMAYYNIIPRNTSSVLSPRGLEFWLATNLFAFFGVAYLGSILSASLRHKGFELEEKREEIKDLQAFNEDIIRSMRGGLLTVDLEGRIVVMNRAGAEITGRGDGPNRATHVRDIFPGFWPIEMDERGTPLALRKEVECRTPYGVVRFLGISISPLRTGQNQLSGYVFNFQDLTELKRLEHEVAVQDRMAALGRLSAAIAHEIRQPLSAMTGALKALARLAPLDDDDQRLVQIVSRESQRLNQIITDFLEYSREKNYEFSDQNVVALLDETLMLFEHQPEFDSTYRIDRRYSNAVVRARVDRNRLKQVFWNLLNNAVRAMPNGGTITINLEAEAVWMRISIRDTGIGIDPSEAARIFEPFQSSFVEGTGLGLAIVYQIVQAHGGRIHLDLRKGSGRGIHHRAAEDGPRPSQSLNGSSARGRSGSRHRNREGRAETMAHVLVVDDERSICELLEITFRKDGHRVELASSGEQAKRRLETQLFDIIVSDINMRDMSGVDLLRYAREVSPESVFLLITGVPTLGTAIDAVNFGADRYVVKGDTLIDELRQAVAKISESIELKKETGILRREIRRLTGLDHIIGTSPKMREIFDLIQTIAPQTSRVLITGESGTGKELVARAIHENSARAKKPFITINCGAFPETLLESELFGYMKGAFTGAAENRRGLFQAAHGGTLFMDEIGNMSLTMQVKLYRVLQEGKVRPLGSTEEHDVDVRVIAATNKDFEKEIAEGRFREDLYYRLSVIPIHLPPLRERREDIPLLARSFLDRYRKSMSKAVEAIEPKAMERLEAYDWPGNVRELENTIERAVALETARWITVEGLPERITRYYQEHRPDLKPVARDLLVPEGGMDLEQKIGEIERAYLLAALESSGGVRVRASELLKMSYRSFRHYAKKHGV